MNWCVSNVVGRYLPGGDDRSSGEGAGSKIDGAVRGMMIGVGRAMLNEPKDFLSNLYRSDEDVLFL